MRPRTGVFRLLAAALLAWPACALADPGDGDQDQPRDIMSGGGDPASSNAPPAPGKAEPESSRGPMDQRDAQINWGTIVETYIAENSPNDYMPLKDRTTGKVWRLVLDHIPGQKFRKVGENRFAGCAILREVSPTGHALDVDFTVDFSGERWRVKDIRIHKIDDKPRPVPRKKPSGL